MKNSILAFLVFVFAGFFQLLSAQIMERPPIKAILKYDYAVKIVAGTQKEKCSKEIGKGVYCSIVNIYNPNPVAVILSKELVLTRPMGQNGESTNIPIGYDTLMSNHAIQVEPTDYIAFNPNLGYLEGFLTLRSTEDIEISTVYTASEYGSKKIESLDIETITQTYQPVEIVEEVGKPDLIPVPFVDGHYIQFFGSYHPIPHGSDFMRIKVRNIGNKSCGPFKIAISHYASGFEERAFPWDTGWSSGLKVDEEKIIVLYNVKNLYRYNISPPRLQKNAYQVFVDVDNTIDELNDNNNSVNTIMAMPGKYIKGIH